MSDTTAKTILDENIAEQLGFGGLSLIEQEVFLDRIGEVVLRQTLQEFMESLNEEQGSALEYYLESEPDTAAMLNHIVSQYPQFGNILSKKIVAFKSEAKDFLAALEK